MHRMEDQVILLFHLPRIVLPGAIIVRQRVAVIAPGNTYLLIGLQSHGGGGGDGYLYPTTYLLHCHHQNNSASRQAAVRDTLMIHFGCVGKVTRQRPKSTILSVVLHPQA